MKKSLFPLLIGCAVVVLASACMTSGRGAFRIEPGEKYRKLLIGSINYEAHGWGYGLDGVFYNGLTLLIQNQETKQEYYIQQNPAEKFFYISSIAPGTYRITKVVYKADDGSTLTLTVGRLQFSVEDVVVNNLGVLSWLADKTNNKHGFWGVGQQDTVEDRLTTLFPKTRWTELEWKPVPIKY